MRQRSWLELTAELFAVQELQANRRHGHNRAPVNIRVLAKNALSAIEKKLRGMHRTGRDRVEKEVSTSNLVQMLIQEATDNANLVSSWLVAAAIADFVRRKCILVGPHGIEEALMSVLSTSFYT